MPTPNAETLLRRLVVKAKFRHMQVLSKLSELGSMRRTAEAVNMTQPAVSQLVADLETLLETPLFFRHARGVEPTQITRDLLPVAMRILEALEDGSEAVANRLMENQGIVRVAACPAGIGGLLFQRLHDFAKQHPSVQLRITEMEGEDPVTGLGAVPADIVCTRAPGVVPEGWQFNPCRSDALVAVCGTSHPFAKLGKVCPEALGRGRWLVARVGSRSRKQFERIAELHNFPKSARGEIIQQVCTLTQDLLRTGEYCTVLPRSVALPWQANGTVVELDTVMSRPLPPLGFLSRKDETSVSVARFASYLQAMAEPDVVAKPRVAAH